MKKTILITGASSGFGRSTALALAARGHRVFGTSRRPDGDLGDVRMLRLDVTDDDSVARCVEQLIDEAGPLDVLINNAGSGLTGAVEDCTSDEIRWQMETNFFGPLRMTQSVLALMRENGGGRIINIGSMAGHAGLPYQAIYSASKHALEGLNEAIRLELAGSGIQSTMVCPGDFSTGFTDARQFAENAHSAHHGPRMRATVALYERDERGGADPEDLARLVVRLVDARSLRVRYFVGRFDQRLGMQLKNLLPDSWFEALMRLIYRIPGR